MVAVGTVYLRVLPARVASRVRSKMTVVTSPWQWVCVSKAGRGENARQRMMNLLFACFC